MEGWIFLLAAWGGWVIATFMLDKTSPLRLVAAVWTLLMVIVYPVSVTIFTIEFTGPALLLVMTAFLLISRVPFRKKIYLFFSVMMIMFGYAGFFLLELYDPVWVLIDRKILLSSGLFALSWLLYPSSFLHRYTAIILGSLQGEVFLSLFLSKWDMPYVVGSPEYLDVFALAFLLLSISFVFSKLIYRLKETLEKRSKGKTSWSLKTGQKAKF